jgi:hypothetical protein
MAREDRVARKLFWEDPCLMETRATVTCVVGNDAPLDQTIPCAELAPSRGS